VLILILFYRQHQREDEENLELELVKDEQVPKELSGVKNNDAFKDNEVNERTENDQTDKGKEISI
jgi:hypothetical protein